MAKAKAKAKAKPEKGAAGAAPPAAGRSGSRFGLGIMMIGMVLLALPTALVLFVAMLPTMVAAIADRTATRNAAMCVGGLNFAGTMPYLLEMWFGDHSLTTAINTLGDVFVLVVIYGSAGMGWLLYLVTPPLVIAVQQGIAQQRIASLRGRQRRLVEEWGEEVRGQPQASD